MKKLIALLLVLALAVPMAGCTESGVLEESYIYSAETQIHSLEIQIGAADLTIKHAETLQVETNLKYLNITEQGGRLRLVEDTTFGVSYENPVLTLYIPPDMNFDRVEITTGAAKLTADRIYTNALKLELGAGDAELTDIHVQTWAQIRGGAGKITLDDSAINNLSLQMGVGKLEMRAALHGDSELTLGVGESDITLMGNKNDYHVEIEKGIGTITVDGKEVTEYESEQDGPNEVEIQGGMGAINLTFENVIKH